MKTFAWLLIASFLVLCLACVPLVHLTQSLYEADFRNGSIPFPTEVLIRVRDWIPAIPVPWIVYAIVLARRQASTDAYFAFAGTLVFGASLVFCCVALGLLAPYFASHILIGSRSPG